jgi:hypothetical protein
MLGFRLSAEERAQIAACVLTTSMLIAASEAPAQPAATPALSAPPAVTYVLQGWSAADRDTFYTTGQGSHMIPYAWFKALRQAEVDEAFAADQLQRYGYLRYDSQKNVEGLPVGFVVESKSGQLGMTCAACHTGQLEYQKDGVTYAIRLDGAPAHADFQQFLVDLTEATRKTLNEPDRFDRFAKAVLGTGFSSAKTAQLKSDFGAWVQQFGNFMDASLPTSPWGPGRLDAFGMIFNRVAGRDLGLEHDPHNNFRVANAPVSYPFLWNASRQDHTQWNGGVPNGLYIQALTRNTGEVFGVFADFKPRVAVQNTPFTPTVIDFKNTSADFAGLQTLEEKIVVLQPPPWPRDIWPIDEPLAEKGRALFTTYCAECHAERASPTLIRAWATPVRAVGTDPTMATNAARTSEPGIYSGALRPPPAINAPFTDPASTAEMLATSVTGSLLDEAFSLPITSQKLEQSGVWRAIRKDLADLVPNKKLNELINPKFGALADFKGVIKARLSNMFVTPASADAGPAYESRVLHGVWATAPFLHNGSVASLWELLLPAKQRVVSFKVGSRKFDPKNVGYATDETPFRTGTFVADPNNANGNGNRGHEYGTDLSEADRWAIVEYLKTL